MESDVDHRHQGQAVSQEMVELAGKVNVLCGNAREDPGGDQDACEDIGRGQHQRSTSIR